jgi:hypothetical protein
MSEPGGLDLEAVKTLAEDAAVRICQILKPFPKHLQAAIIQVLQSGFGPRSIEDRCGAAPDTDTHEVGSLPRDCQRCTDWLVGRSR